MSSDEYSEEEQERDRLNSLLAMALVSKFWNDIGEITSLPILGEKSKKMARYMRGDYLGNNIAARQVSTINEPFLEVGDGLRYGTNHFQRLKIISYF